MAFAAMLLFAIISPCAKLLLAQSPIDSVMIASLRLIGSAIFLLLLLPILPRQRIQRGDILSLLLMSLCGMALSMYSYTMGIGLTLPSHAGILTTLPPMFVLLLGWVFLKQRIPWMRAVGIAIAAIGVLILVVSNSHAASSASNILLGDALCLLAQLLLACYFVFFTGLIKRYHPFVLLSWLFGISSLIVLPFVWDDILHFPWAQLSASSWGYILAIVLGSTLIPYLLITGAQRILAPSVVTCYNYVQPLTALLLSLAWGIETMSWGKAIAISLILIGLSIVIELIKAPTKNVS